MNVCDPRLKQLRAKYGPRAGPHDGLRERALSLYTRYTEKRQSSLVDSAAVAAGLSVETLREAQDPQIIEAFQKQFPNVDIDTLSSYPDEKLAGFVNGAKGKYFEILVKDKLNAGEQVGGLRLNPGQEAVLADSARQEGWDLRIVGEDGHVDQLLQAKATDQIAHIREALERYPDIPVVTTHEIASRTDLAVIDSGIHDAAIEEHVGAGVGELSESALEDFLDYMNPLIPVAVICLTEGRAVLIGRSTWRQALEKGGRRAGKGIAALSVGAAFAAFDMGVVSIPASIITRLMFDHFDKTPVSLRHLERHTQALRRTLRHRVPD